MEEPENDDLIVVIVEDDPNSTMPSVPRALDCDFSSFKSRDIGIKNPMELLLTVIKEEIKDDELTNSQIWDEEGISVNSEKTDTEEIAETSEQDDYTQSLDLHYIKETEAHRELKMINQSWQDIQNQIDKCNESIIDVKSEQYLDEELECVEEELEDIWSLKSEGKESEALRELKMTTQNSQDSQNQIDKCNENIIYIKSEQYSEEELECTEDEELEDNWPLKSGRNIKQKKVYKKRKLPPGSHSYVSDLREQFPELKEDEGLLVQVLASIMKDLKVPPLPVEYCREKDFKFECNICKSLTDTLPAAGRHYQERHGPRYLICYCCGINFRSRTNLYKHEKICGAKDRKIVLKARAIFLGRKGQNRPYLKTSSMPQSRKFPCTQCSAQFTSKQSLESHINKHLGRRPYRCDKCPNAYTCPLVFKRHWLTHDKVPYICDICKRTFKTKSSLATHMDTHLPAKKFGCPDCDRRYATKHALSVHVNRLHKNIPDPFACQVCPKRYAKMSQLKDHMKKIHNLTIMSRNMFLKRLPTLSDEDVLRAKAIMKLKRCYDTEPVTVID